MDHRSDRVFVHVGFFCGVHVLRKRWGWFVGLGILLVTDQEMVLFSLVEVSQYA